MQTHGRVREEGAIRVEEKIEWVEHTIYVCQRQVTKMQGRVKEEGAIRVEAIIW